MDSTREQIIFDRNKRKLESYIELKYIYESKERELLQLEEKIETLTGAQGIKYSDMPKGGKPVLFTDYINDLIDKEKILRNSFRRAERRKEKIEEAIDTVSDEELRIILRMKYIEDFSYSKIGYLTYLGKTTVWRKCNEGIRKINL